MRLTRDARPLAHFQQNPAEFLERLKRTGQPLLLTIDGKAELVVQDAKSYERFLDLADRLETIQAVKEGLASADRGEGQPLDAVFEELEKEIRAKART